MPIFSGEPLPVAPKVDNAELDSFHRKVLDYLRRLSAKLDSQALEDDIDDPVGFGQVEAFSAFLENFQAVSSSGTYGAIVVWEQTLWQDTPYSVSGGRITINKDGFYIFFIDLNIEFSGFVDAVAVLALIDDMNQVLGVPSFARGHIVPHGYTITIGLPLPAFTRVAVFLKTNIDDPAGLIPSGTRINIIRVRNNIDGGDSEGPGIGWEPDPDNGDFPTWVDVAEL